MIKLYGADWCGPCGQLKNALKNKGIEYEYINVDDHAEEVALLGIRAIPVIVREDCERISGFPGIAESIDFIEGGLT